ncbi:MAG: response regulator [Candidatus Omnitrophota bacterium]
MNLSLGIMDKKDFIAIFKGETEERLVNIDKGLVKLEKDPNKLEIIKELNREAHTIKGSARIFGYGHIQEISHSIEDVFAVLQKKELAFNSEVANKIFRGLDSIRNILEEIDEKGENAQDADISSVLNELKTCLTTFSQGGKDNDAPGNKAQADKKQGAFSVARPKTADKGASSQNTPPKEDKPNRQNIKTAPATIQQDNPKNKNTLPTKVINKDDKNKASSAEEYIRVPLSRVNKLLNLVGEMVINKMKSSSKIAQAKHLFVSSKELQKRISDITEMLKKGFSLEYVEMSKLVSMCNAQIQRLREESLQLYDNISTEAMHLDPVIDELQTKMKEIRMLPCSTIFEGFPRMVRDIALQENKGVNLEISGESTELDKKVLEGIKIPLIHLLRNCIDHGIEDAKERKTKEKLPQGTIKLSAYHEAGNVVIVVEDDGRGLDVEEIKQVVLKKHLLPGEELKKMKDKEVLNLVFMDGYSSSPIITDVSGRGIGLDIVRRDIEGLKGQVILDTEKGKGTKFILILPLTIAIIQVLLIKQNEMLFALPMTTIVETLKINMRDVSTIEGRMAIQVREHTVPVVKMSQILNLPPRIKDIEEGEEDDEHREKELPVVIATSLEKRVGFIVDEVVGEEEVFIKNLGGHLGKIKNVSGATILATGEVMIILDVAGLIMYSALSHPALVERRALADDNARQDNKILVVDDALSARELEKSILESQGYIVDTAVDGMDGLDKAMQANYNLIVSDVQMPRMDGFEFCRTLKKNEHYKNIPVIIVTALEKEEDKKQGIDVGASAYIVKSSFEQTNLLDTIERLIG